MSRTRRTNFWPCVFWSPDGDESKVFNGPDEVPVGWVTKRPDHVFEPIAPRLLDPVSLRQMLIDRGVKVDPTWSAAYMESLLK